jgi:acetyl esterase/lipase
MTHELDLTPYLLDTAEPRGAVIVFPGGGYTHCADHEGEPVARMFNENGIHAFVLRYPVNLEQKGVLHPSPLLAAQRAVREVRQSAEENGIAPDHIAVMGFSAGGHLASTIATHFDSGNPDAEDPVERASCRPDAAILCYPVISLCEEFAHSGSRTNLLGADASDELIEQFSNERQVSADTPPSFLWHTAEDAGVPMEHSLYYASACRKQGIPVELHVFPNGRHGLGLAADIPGTNEWPALCVSWLKRLGY